MSLVKHSRHFIIVEVGKFADGHETPSYQIFEELTNDTWRKAEELPDGKPNDPAYLRDVRRRLIDMRRTTANTYTEVDLGE